MLIYGLVSALYLLVVATVTPTACLDLLHSQAAKNHAKDAKRLRFDYSMYYVSLLSGMIKITMSSAILKVGYFL